METNIDIGNGLTEDQEVLANKAERSGEPMAGNSLKSRKKTSRKGKSSKSEKKALSREDVLAILENALWTMKEYWTPPRVVDSTSTVIVLPQEIRYCQKCNHFRLIDSMSNGTCKSCDKTVNNITLEAV